MILDELNQTGINADPPVFEWGISKAESAQIVGGEGKLISPDAAGYHIGSNGLEAVDYSGLINRISKFAKPNAMFFYRNDQLVGRYYEIDFYNGEKDFRYLSDELSAMYGQASDSFNDMPDLFLELITDMPGGRESAEEQISDSLKEGVIRMMTWMIDENTSVSLFGDSHYDPEKCSAMWLFYAHPAKTE